MKYVPDPAQEIGESLLRDKSHQGKGLFMGCGLGKTATCLSVVSEKLLDLEIRGVLVLSPLRVNNMNWPFEHLNFENFSWMRAVNLRTKEGWQALEEKSAHIYCINYESCHKIIDFLKGKQVKNWPFDAVIFDELTFLKNPKSKTAKLLRPYVFKLKHRWGLTGTPNPNSLLELFGQIRMLDKGEALGKSFSAFRSRYFEALDYHKRDWQPLPWAEKAIKEKIESFCVMLSTEDYIDLPDIQEIDYEIELPSEHRSLYKKLEKDLFALLDEDSGDYAFAPNKAVLKDKLLQITSGCLYSLTENDDRTTQFLHNSKIDAVKAIKKKEKSPLLVFCNFIEEQKRLLEELPGSVAISSAKTEEQQKNLENQWNSGKIPYLVSHPKSAAHGLNLQHGGSTVVWTTPTHSGEYYGQGNRRVARKGQKFPPKVYRILCKKTVDFAVVDSLRKKKFGELALAESLKAYKSTLKLF